MRNIPSRARCRAAPGLGEGARGTCSVMLNHTERLQRSSMTASVTEKGMRGEQASSFPPHSQPSLYDRGGGCERKTTGPSPHKCPHRDLSPSAAATPLRPSAKNSAGLTGPGQGGSWAHRKGCPGADRPGHASGRHSARPAPQRSAAEDRSRAHGARASTRPRCDDLQARAV